MKILTRDKLKPEVYVNPSTGEEETLTPAENYLDLQVPLEFKLGYEDIGGLMLGTSDSIPPTIVFGFSFTGIHHQIDDAALCALADKLESGLKQLPVGRMTIHFSAMGDDLSRQKELKLRGEACDNHLLRLLNSSSKKRTKELTEKGLREPKEIFIYCTYRCKPIREDKKMDWLQSLLFFLNKAAHQVTGKKKEFEDIELHEVLMQGYNNGLIAWSDALEKMGLRVKPLNGDALYRNLYRRFNNCDPEFVPQMLEVYEDRIEQVINTEVHNVSYLFNKSVPSFHRTCVKVKNELQAVLVMDDKPRGFRDLREEFLYFWQKIARDNISDVDIFAEIKLGSYRAARKGVEQLSRYSKNIEEKAQKYKDSTTKAERNISEAKALEHSLEDGNLPHPLGVVFLVRQKMKGFSLKAAQQKLAKKCRMLQSKILLPASTYREEKVAHKLWLQTLPGTIDDILTSQFENKKLSLLSNEVWGLLPLANTLNLRKGGFEFIAEHGSSPVNFNLLDLQNHINAAVFATTRGGKSVVLSEMITSALMEKVPVVALDFPKQNGDSTFYALTKQLGSEVGAYFNISKESLNLFERPLGLSRMSVERREMVMTDFKALLESILKIRIFGLTESKGAVAGTPVYSAVNSILAGALNNFFEDGEIVKRFERAEQEGMGSAAWSSIPTLEDFPAFCTLEKAKQYLNIEGLSEQILQDAVTLIQLGIYGLQNSRIGKAISRPSSVKADVRLLVFAFTQVEQDEDAAVLALIATAAAYRSALKSSQSVFIIDETPIMFGYEIVAKCVHRLTANGAKSGIHVVISAQGANVLERTKLGKEILENISVRIVGKILPDAVPSFCRILGYTKEEIEQCCSFTRNAQGLFTRWLLTDKGVSESGEESGITTKVRYYPPLLLLGLVANNEDEQKVRELFYATYDDPDVALKEFSKFLALSIRTQTPLLEMVRERFGQDLSQTLVAA